jgi:DNA-binding beta-propeller fold protein YncE
MTTDARTTTNSRISIFNSKYALVGTIDTSGDFGMTFRPTDLAVSLGDVLYVSDISAGSVLLFDATGTSQGEIMSADARFSPVSLAFSPDGTLLYVSSDKTQSIHRFTGVQ